MKRTIENGNCAVGFRPGHRGEIDEIGSGTAIQNIPGCTHPGAEGGTMGGFLMMGIMMGFVRDRLRRGEAPEDKNTEDKSTSK